MSLADTVSTWAAGQPAVKALALIGSRARSADDPIWQADHRSDWDFYVITSAPAVFLRPDWARSVGLAPKVYTVRTTVLGGVPKIGAIFGRAEADFVMLSPRQLRLAYWALGLGFVRPGDRIYRRLQNLAIVLRPGWTFLKGGDAWDPVFRRVVGEVADPRLSDAAASALAESFVCDWVWTKRKIERGEWVAAQRMLHRELVETTLRLWHEVRLRQHLRSFPDARRLERVASLADYRPLAVSATLDAPSLTAAADKCAVTLIALMAQFPGASWTWPVLDGFTQPTPSS